MNSEGKDERKPAARNAGIGSPLAVRQRLLGVAELL